MNRNRVYPCCCPLRLQFSERAANTHSFNYLMNNEQKTAKNKRNRKINKYAQYNFLEVHLTHILSAFMSDEH